MALLLVTYALETKLYKYEGPTWVQVESNEKEP